MTDTAVLRIRVESSGIGKAGSDLSQLSKQGVSAESVLSKLRSVALSVSTALAANAVIKYSDAWTNVSNKLANVTKSGESLLDVQNRVFAISQRSNSSIEATATLYGRLEPATRGLINSGSELGDVIETINKAMSVSGASSSEAAGALVQLAQGLGAGALRGEEFNSVNEAAPRLMQAIADSLGVTRGELRNYAAQGKLTSEVVINAMRSQSAAIDTEFSKMNVTFEQKGVKAYNNLIKAFGENSNVTSAVGSLGDVLVTLSEHVDLVIKAGEVLAVTYSSRLVGAISQSIQTKVADISANIQLASANLKAAQAAVTQATAEKESAIAAQQSLVAQLQLAQSERTRAAIRQQLAVNSAAVAAATNAETAAISRLTAATNAASIAQRTFNGTMALVGGPAGVAMLAAAAIYYFYEKSQESTQGALDFADSLDTTTQKLKEMTPVALAAADAKLVVALQEQEEKAADLREELTNLEDKYRSGTSASGNYQLSQSQLADLHNQIAIKAGEVEDAENKVSQTRSKQQAITAQLNGTNRENYVLTGQMNKVTGIASGIQLSLNNALKIGNQELQKRNNYVLTSTSIFTDKDKNALEGLQRQINLEKLQGEQRAKLQAQYEAQDKGLSGAGAEKYVNDSIALYRLQQANDKLTESQKNATKAIKSTAEAHQALIDKVSDLRTQLEAAQLRYHGNEEAALKLETSHELGAQAASKEGQQIQSLTLQLYRLKQAQEAAAQKKEDMNYLNNLLAGNDPTKQENNRYQQELAEFKQHAQNKNYTQQQINQAELAMANAHTENLKQIEQQRVDQLNQIEQQLLGNASTVFDGLAGIAQAYGGEQSKTYMALFAVSKAFSIAQATMSIATGLAKAQELGWPANLAAMAQVASAGASIMSTISGANYSGAYDKGGYIPAGSYGIVAEKGNELVNGTLIHGPANVTSRKQTAAMLNNSNSNSAQPVAPVVNTNVRMVNVIDPSVVNDYLGSAEGEKVILNVIRNNPGVIKSVGNM